MIIKLKYFLTLFDIEKCIAKRHKMLKSDTYKHNYEPRVFK